MRVEQQVRILALFAANLSVLERGLVAQRRNDVLRIGSVFVIAQTNAVKQVGLRLAGNLELAALGRQRLALGILDEIGVADKRRIFVAFLAHSAISSSVMVTRVSNLPESSFLITVAVAMLLKNACFSLIG